MRHKSKRKTQQKKYRRLLAAVAVAAVLSTAMLPGGLPAKVQASPVNSLNLENIAIYDKAVKPNWAGSPVSLVKANARKYGFNPNTDRFSLLSQTRTKATVQVKSGDRTFKVDLTRKGFSQWKITVIRGIGNMKYPASYTPASFFEPQQNITLTAAEIPDSVLMYRNNAFANWTWQDSSAPADLSFGVLVQDSPGKRRIPAEVYDRIKGMDLQNRLVLYAALGNEKSDGYGIGIEQIAAADDRITVTVRTKSPRPNERGTTGGKPYDIVSLDRTALNFWSPLHITFVDQNNKTLRSYTVVLR
ncbi:protease complex subunit PrcB family protein [Acetonema longum]|uniref:PrcB C-terminal domain-containing protein n=1 Tax=Acetonema longum DSM 6540 TaxID=1009370 RepID=F7NP99_9FIRM|nr:protease complex subunit PrcB family protein [Acetonema longum]EGO62222.1 hypothetical protein ALO_19712 [Acetonema longum DSM 6540]